MREACRQGRVQCLIEQALDQLAGKTSQQVRSAGFWTAPLCLGSLRRGLPGLPPLGWS